MGKSELDAIVSEAGVLLDRDLIRPRQPSLTPIDTHFTGGHCLLLDDLLFKRIYNCKPAQDHFLVLLNTALEGKEELARRVWRRYESPEEKPYDIVLFRDLDGTSFQEPKLTRRMIGTLFHQAKGLHERVMAELRGMPVLPLDTSEIQVAEMVNYLFEQGNISPTEKSRLKKEYKRLMNLRGVLELPNLLFVSKASSSKVSPSFERIRQTLHEPLSRFKFQLGEGNVYEAAHHLITWSQGLCYFLSAELQPVDLDEVVETFFSNPILTSNGDHELPAYTTRSGFIANLLLERFWNLFPGKVRGYHADSSDEGHQPKYGVDVLVHTGDRERRRFHIHSSLEIGKDGKRTIDPEELLHRPSLLIQREGGRRAPTEDEVLGMVEVAAKARGKLPESFGSLPPEVVRWLRDLHGVSEAASEYSFAHRRFSFERLLSERGLAMRIMEQGGKDAYDSFLQGIDLEGALMRTRLLKKGTTPQQPDVWLGTFYVKNPNSRALRVEHRVVKYLPKEREQRQTMEALYLASVLAPETGIQRPQYQFVKPGYLVIQFLGHNTREERALRNSLFFNGEHPVLKAELEDTLKVAGTLLGRTPKKTDSLCVRKYREEELDRFAVEITAGLEQVYQRELPNREAFTKALAETLRIREGTPTVVDWDLTLRNAGRTSFFDPYLRVGTMEEIVTGVLPNLPSEVGVIEEAVKRVVTQYINPARESRLALLDGTDHESLRSYVKSQAIEWFTLIGVSEVDARSFGSQLASNIRPPENPYSAQFMPSHVLRSVALRQFLPPIRVIKGLGGTEKDVYSLKRARRWAEGFTESCMNAESGAERARLTILYEGLHSLG
ncbi:MAG TPA: hypothetical protein VJG90_05565 [Candidatus Nanoarchaeia archaeon]|nr:hypothetical protein [Candidatus Nanoarchaeia archaeon]